jgi:hypothetical protein
LVRYCNDLKAAAAAGQSENTVAARRPSPFWTPCFISNMFVPAGKR